MIPQNLFLNFPSNDFKWITCFSYSVTIICPSPILISSLHPSIYSNRHSIFCLCYYKRLIYLSFLGSCLKDGWNQPENLVAYIHFSRFVVRISTNIRNSQTTHSLSCYDFMQREFKEPHSLRCTKTSRDASLFQVFSSFMFIMTAS